MPVQDWLKQDVAALAAMLEALPVALVLCDEDDRIRLANGAARRLLPALAQADGRPRSHLLPAEGVCRLSGRAVHICAAQTERGTAYLLQPAANDQSGGQERGGAQSSSFRLEQILTLNPEMEELKRQAALAARAVRTPVLLTGESGTGKELFARAIHAASPRQAGPLVAVNCAAVPENLLEAEFFGYADGAFTGARRGGKPGLFERASGGTLFLDEIAEMSPALQAKLLRAVQQGEIERVGGLKPVPVDLRIIAATNRDLAGMVAESRFREDLYYRISVITLYLPPLRQRREDIPLLAELLLEELSGGSAGIAPEAIATLERYDWPGNVRELRNVLERAVALAPARMVSAADLPAHVRAAVPAGRRDGPYRRSVAEAGREAIEAALRSTGGNKMRAARMLGISRSRLYEKLK